MFSILKSRAKPEGLSCLTFTSEGFALAHVVRNRKAQSELKVCEFFSGDDLDASKANLFAAVVKHGLQGASCNWVLSQEDYRLLLIDPPDVPAAEYQTAARWLIKDMIDFPLEDAAVDTFPLMDISEKPKKLYLVAARISFLKSMADSIHASGLQLIAIDIHEMAMRNLVSLFAEKDELLGFLQLNTNDCLFIVIQNDFVQLARRIGIGLTDLKDENKISAFHSEIQRSLDYYQNQFKQEGPNKLLLAPLLEEDMSISQKATHELVINLQRMDLRSKIVGADTLSTDLQAQCLVAIGGALRDERGKK